MKYYFLFFLFISAISVQSQDLLFSSGLNYSTYEYKNSLGQTNNNLSGGRGGFFEISYLNKIDKKQKLKYLVGLVLNEFNADGGNLVSDYSWRTSYLGVKGGFTYNVISTKSGFNAELNIAINANTIISGEQRINGMSYDLTKQDEFKGYFLQSIAGLGFSYAVSKKTSIGVGYSYSKNLKINNKTDEVLGFKNNQLQFKLQFKLK